jgi:hypothetical protein
MRNELRSSRRRVFPGVGVDRKDTLERKTLKSRVSTPFCCYSLVVFRSSLNGQSSAVVPRLVNFSGIARDERGNPISGIAGATSAIYKEESGGSPIAFSRIHAP